MNHSGLITQSFSASPKAATLEQEHNKFHFEMMLLDIIYTGGFLLKSICSFNDVSRLSIRTGMET